MSLFSLADYIKNQPQNQLENQNQNQNQIQTPQINPEIIQGAISKIRDLSDYIEKHNPHPENYHPSRLRSILGNVAGGLYGIGTSNPQAGMGMARTIRNAPINDEMQRYREGMQAPQEQANLGISEARLAGMSAENLYKYIQGQHAISEINKNNRDISKPNITNLPAVIPPGGTLPIAEQQNEQYNPRTGQWDVYTINRGTSPVSTPQERERLHGADRTSREKINQNTQEHADKREGSREQNQRTIASIRASGSKNRLKIELMSKQWGTLPPAYQKEISQNVYTKHPEYFTVNEIVDSQGNKTHRIELNSNMTTQQRADYQTAIADESQDILLKHNHAIGTALSELDSGNKNPLVIDEEDYNDEDGDNQ